MSDVLRMTLTRVARDKALPLELKVPNAETRAAMEEARAAMKARAAGSRRRKPCSMPSNPRPGNPKRANPPPTCDFTKAFRKDWERLTRSGRFNMAQLKEAMLLLIANDGPLGPEWLDHPLKGDWGITANATSAATSC